MGEGQAKHVDTSLYEFLQNLVGVRSRAYCRYNSRAPHEIPFVFFH